MISRYIVILLAFVAAVVQASRGAYTESIGLFGLGAGLVALRFSSRKPALKYLAYAGFAATALAIALVIAGRM